MPEKKSDIVRRLVTDGEYKKALRIAKDFRLGISKADSEAVKRGYECMLYPGTYAQLGIDTDKAVESGISTLSRLYGGGCV
ncbi:hypothetical protein AGMMS49975_16620 [Clostridia bacterium]|nr:hypothetical protein AGMMS49975_16620 [Clostridia bacterium]